jgi:hypothetical protein
VTLISRLFVGSALSLISLAVIPHDADAAKPEDAPAESRAQVDNAQRVLAPFFAGRTRAVSSQGPGSIESVLASYAPLRFHPVSEGSLPAPQQNATCPEGMALIGGRFCIDKWEATIELVAPDGTARSHPANEALTQPPSGYLYRARTSANVLPQSYISGREAEAACAVAQKRLCEPVEWRAACGGSDGFAYPYGPTKKPNTCHDTGASPMLVIYPEQVKRGFFGTAEMNDPRLNLVQNGLAKTGQYASCVTDAGVFDMVGNLHEWTRDPNGTFQGGFWLDTHEHGDGCAYRTIAHDFGYHDYSTGFRCCKDPTTTP